MALHLGLNFFFFFPAEIKSPCLKQAKYQPLKKGHTRKIGHTCFCRRAYKCMRNHRVWWVYYSLWCWDKNCLNTDPCLWLWGLTCAFISCREHAALWRKRYVKIVIFLEGCILHISALFFCLHPHITPCYNPHIIDYLWYLFGFFWSPRIQDNSNPSYFHFLPYT